MRCSQPDQTVLGNGDDASCLDDSIPRRFPRIGAQFQTRISKSTGHTIRPAPDRMSVEFPFILEKEAGEQDEVEANVPLKSKHRPAATNSGFDLKFNDSKSNRGGLLMHKPSKEKTAFSKYVEPFMISTRNQVRPKISNEAWIQHMIHLHSTETTGKRNRACRGSGKRKRAENEELIWNLENILDNLQKHRRDIGGSEMLGEEEATALQHLWLFFDGNIDAAEFNLLVKLSGGQATKMRKCEEKERAKRKSKIPSQQTSESWRDMYQLSTSPYAQTVLGQLQDDAAPLYAMETTTTLMMDGNSGEHNDVKLVLEADDSKGAWRSILACGKSIERQLNSESLGVGDKKPLLSTLLTFVGRAYALPTPESCFGTHHVMIEEVSNTIIFILNHVKNAQNVHAKIRDKMFDESHIGIDSDDLLKFLDTEYSALPIRLREVDKLYQFRDIIVRWESRLLKELSVPEEGLDNPNMKNYLRIAEDMQHEARSHGYRSKVLVQLNTRINKAYDLRDRILRWKCASEQGKMTTVKTVSGFVKEAKRIKLFSPEVLEMFEFHRLAEEWIDRANIAIRSKISLDEVKNLVKRGEEMPLDLSEYIDKLKTRVRIADDWLESLDEILPFKNNTCTRLQIWQDFETALQNGIHNRLHDLSSEGNRIPVDVVAVKLLQLAMDARNWTTKALKWVPNNIDSKKGKLCDLREHVDKLSSLRSKLPLQEVDRRRWKPAGEKELSSIIIAADSWTEKYKAFLAGDNRKSDQRSCLSINKLRSIVDEGNAIYANIGNSISKISRILLQAENWYKSYLPLLQRCGISREGDTIQNSPKSFITIQEMSAAVEAARTDVALDLDEAMELRKFLDKSNFWNKRVALIAPKRNKRHNKGSRSKFTLKDLIGLVEEASSLPIHTEESVNRLQIQLNNVENWRSDASKKILDILVQFNVLKCYVDDIYGEAGEYSIDRISDTYDSDEESSSNQCEASSSNRFNTDGTIDKDQMVTSGDKQNVPVVNSLLETPIPNRGSNSSLIVFRLIRELEEEANDISVITAEGEIGELLGIVSKWCMKSFKYLNTPREVFDKRFFGAFDRFVLEGEDLCKLSYNSELYSNSADGQSKQLFEAWGGVVKDQLLRLTILKREREKFEDWCKHASQILADQKRLTAQKLTDLAKTSRHFPANRDLVSKIRGLAVKVSKWTTIVKSLFQSGERIDFQDARNLVETGEKLKVQTEELKRLKAEVWAARNWSNRAKECNVEQGSIHINDVKELIEEHNSLLIEMPDDLEILKQATIGYCICRRPYDGFMIGCDHCEEWYHGSCIGLSESKAERCEKFTCVRCATKNIFNSSAVAAVGVIKKWTCAKNLKKARQIEYQKLQRKDRKEKKDIEKFSKQIKTLEDQLSELKQSDNGIKDNNTVMEFEEMSAGNILFRRDSIEKKIEIPIEQSDDPSTNIVSLENGEATNITNDGNLLTSNETSTLNVSKSMEDTVCKIEETENMNLKPSKAAVCGSISDTTKINVNGVSSMVSSKADVVSNLNKAKISLQLSKERLKKITNQTQQRILNEAREDKHSRRLQNWCLKVRSEVLAPSEEAKSELSRPMTSGAMSLLMEQVVDEAKHQGISDLSDVRKIVDCLKTICWSFSVMGVLRCKPSISEVRHLISETKKFKLRDEKALRTLKFMANRASQLQSKIKKALSPKKGDAKPIKVSLLNDLLAGIQELPVFVPEEEILKVVIKDNGTRHCVCGGPCDGKKMFTCEFCKKRFHESCMKSKKVFSSNEQTEQLSCPLCKEAGTASDHKLILESPGETVKDSLHQSDVSPHAPNPFELWPPFGLHKSQTAIQAFGSECLALPYVASANIRADLKTNAVMSVCQLPTQKPIATTTSTVRSEANSQEQFPKIKMKKIAEQIEPSPDTPQGDEISSSIPLSPNLPPDAKETRSGMEAAKPECSSDTPQVDEMSSSKPVSPKLPPQVNETSSGVNTAMVQCSSDTPQVDETSSSKPVSPKLPPQVNETSRGMKMAMVQYSTDTTKQVDETSSSNPVSPKLPADAKEKSHDTETTKAEFTTQADKHSSSIPVSPKLPPDAKETSHGMGMPAVEYSRDTTQADKISSSIPLSPKLTPYTTETSSAIRTTKAEFLSEKPQVDETSSSIPAPQTLHPEIKETGSGMETAMVESSSGTPQVQISSSIPASLKHQQQVKETGSGMAAANFAPKTSPSCLQTTNTM